MITSQYSARYQDLHLADFIRMYLAHEQLDWDVRLSMSSTLVEGEATDGDWTGTFEEVEIESDWVYFDLSDDEAASLGAAFA